MMKYLIVDITPAIAAQSIEFSDSLHGDPADRLIIAAALVLGATLVTRDAEILEWNTRYKKIDCLRG